MKINNFGASIVPPEQPAASSSPSRGATAPSSHELQARIEQGIQKAAQNLDQIMGAVTGNANLVPVEVEIQEVMKEIQSKRRDEDEIKDAVKDTEETGDSQLQKAAQSLEDATDAVTKFGDH
jgi:hypothetical protein